jgi:hypothetical protein
MGGPTSSFAAAGIGLEFIDAHKPPHPATRCFRKGGDTIEGDTSHFCIGKLKSQIFIYNMLRNKV